MTTPLPIGLIDPIESVLDLILSNPELGFS